ncbi:hypothetical protein CVT26_006780 [Gymnopilus dilepis]|uniref:Uncharacterized protein n=1 Tax=Gymnopilus dilepis TaxID=231916 RepID=A0A409Y382_9AGAR|nr:hypothetical protein CVT26_006780 [Gymnopilus dilepis]
MLDQTRADLHNLSPRELAKVTFQQRVHPDYRDIFMELERRRDDADNQETRHRKTGATIQFWQEHKV